MGSFCKNEDCPTSEELLAFQTGELELKNGTSIRRHIAACEFCAAEIEFYDHYPPAEESVEPEKIPQPLFDLAEALLRDKKDKSAFYRLVKD